MEIIGYGEQGVLVTLARRLCLGQNSSMSETFTNEDFFHLSSTEQREQMRVIIPIRERHTQELIESGSAIRILGSLATGKLHDSGLIILPLRRPFWSSARLQTASREFPDSKRVQVYTDREDATYDLFLGMIGDSMKSGKPAGILFSDSVIAALGGLKYRARSGVLVDDLVLIEQQLGEIEDLRTSYNLNIIDPVTLTEGPGETMINP